MGPNKNNFVEGSIISQTIVGYYNINSCIPNRVLKLSPALLAVKKKKKPSRKVISGIVWIDKG